MRGNNRSEKHILLHLDLDMFFAAVELRAQPYLRGKPVIVGNKSAIHTRRGVVQTCTYEARKYGVRSGMSMHEALTLCPDAHIVSDARKEYRATSRRIMSFLSSMKIPHKITSVDEAYLDLSPLVRNYQEAQALGKFIKKRILQSEQITSSIGIGPTLIIAKMASDFDKPDGTTVVPPKKIREFISTQKLSNIPGIGNKAAMKMQQKGFVDCRSLVSWERAELRKGFGDRGEFLYRVFRGLTKNRITTRGKRKSISHENTFYGRPGDTELYYDIIERLFEKSYQRLREEGWSTRTVNIKVRFNGFSTLTRSHSLAIATQNREKLRDITSKLFQPFLSDHRGIRLMGVGFSNLSKMELKQLSLTQFLIPSRN